MSDGNNKPEFAMPFDMAQFGAMGSGTFESMAEASRTMLEASATMNREIFDFVSTRLNEDIAAQQKLLQSRTFEDMQRVYSDFFQSASQHYMLEMQKLMGMATDGAKDAAETVSKPRRK